MLLLILCAACLASSAAQITTDDFATMEMSTMTTPPSSTSVMSTTAASIRAPSTGSAESFVAILQIVVQSSRELNATTVDPILKWLSETVQQNTANEQNQSVENLRFTVKNITKV